ncbi:MAG: DUF935 family protein [Burkholderiales bacterium]|nr:DUF935 family protein [Burkholderiales bacterium]
MATILDQHGKPLTQEIASIERDLHRTFYGRRLTNDDDTLVTRGKTKGLRIYEELKRDAHAGAVLNKRKLAVTSRPWSVQPASKAATDVKAAELVTQALDHLRFNRLCKRLLDAQLKGFSVAEVMWEVRDGLWLPSRVMARDPRRFIFTLDGELRLLTREAPLEGEALPDRKFIVHRYGGDDDTPYGLGLGSQLFWPVFFKRQGITFWLTFADKFGSPTAIGKYSPSADDTERKKLLAALASIAQDAGVIIPDGMVIELLEASRAGSVDTYEKLVRYMDEQISKVVLGETMSTTAAPTGLGSTQASVHNDVRLELAQDDADELGETLDDTLIRWIVEFNLGAGVGVPKLKRTFSEPEDLSARATRDKTISEMGWEPTEEYMLATYGPGWVRKAPTPDPLQTLLGGPPSTQQDPGADTTGDRTVAATDADPAGEFSEADAGKPLQAAAKQRTAHRQAQATLFNAADTLAADYQRMLGDQVQDLLAQFEESQDLPTFRKRLVALANAQPSKAAVDAIARATFAGHIIGRGQAPKPAGGLRAMISRMFGG